MPNSENRADPATPHANKILFMSIMLWGPVFMSNEESMFDIHSASWTVFMSIMLVVKHRFTHNKDNISQHLSPSQHDYFKS